MDEEEEPILGKMFATLDEAKMWYEEAKAKELLKILSDPGYPQFVSMAILAKKGFWEMKAGIVQVQCFIRRGVLSQCFKCSVQKRAVFHQARVGKMDD
ncbi:hypothetical protein Droror1_Dr00016237 [Drosera rotundifolia]